MTPLHEQYRPTCWADVVGQDKALARIRAIAKRGIGGRAVWVSGQSGTGKTTIGRLLAHDIADTANIEEIDAAECTPAYLRDLERRMSYYGMGQRNVRAFLVNEAHGLRKDAIRQLLVLLERLPDHVCIVFTTTCEGQEALFEDAIDANPLLSRCTRIELSRQGLAKPFAERARSIAESEGLNGRPIEAYVRLAQRCRNNLRAMLMEIEAGAMVAE